MRKSADRNSLLDEHRIIFTVHGFNICSKRHLHVDHDISCRARSATRSSGIPCIVRHDGRLLREVAVSSDDDLHHATQLRLAPPSRGSRARRKQFMPTWSRCAVGQRLGHVLHLLAQLYLGQPRCCSAWASCTPARTSMSLTSRPSSTSGQGLGRERAAKRPPGLVAHRSNNEFPASAPEAPKMVHGREGHRHSIT